MTTQVRGDLRVITSTPAKITSVDVRSTTTRPSGDGLMLGQWVTLSKPGEFNAASGEVDFPAVPGPAQIKLFSGGSTVGSVALIVPDAESASLADCVRLVGLADEATRSELERLAAEALTAVSSARDAVRDAGEALVTAQESIEVVEGHADRAETAEAGAVTARTGAEAGQELSEDAAAVAVAAAVGAAEASSDKADTTYVDAQNTALGKRITDEKWNRGIVRSTDTLDTLSEGAHEVAAAAVARNLGIPYGVIGSVEIFDSNQARTASYITNHASNPRLYVNSRVSGVWSGWKLQTNFDDLAAKADKTALDAKADKTDLEAKADRDYVDESIAALETGGDSLNMALLGAPVTPWEVAGIVTNYDQGELYLDQVKTQFVFVKKVTVGQTYLGKDINALVIGDDTKPVVMIECGTHGNEVAPREAVLIWARKAAQYRTWMDHLCLVIIPTVNGDRTGHNRENAQSKDINRDFGTFETSEAQAVRDAFDTYSPVFYLCCHEFEHTTDVNDIETSSPSNYAWFTNQNIIDVTDRVVDVIWSTVQAKGAKVDHYYTTTATEPEGPVDTAMSWLMRVKETPSVLIETAGGLYPKTYGQSIGVHPARYTPPLGWRVDLYDASLNAALDEIAKMIQEQVIQ